MPTIRKTVLWTKEQLLHDLPELEQISGPDFMRPIEAVSFHQKTAGPGMLVIPAIEAKAFRAQNPDFPPKDQEQITRNALLSGASAIILDSTVDANFPDYAPVFRCADRNAVFKRLARLGRQRLTGDIIGITGSYGKTTTREMTGQMLSFMAPTSASIDNRNAVSGVCETLASLSAFTHDCVLELGVSIPETMAEIGELAQPNIAILTAVADSHIENYPSIEALLREKVQILEHVSGDFPALVGRSVLSLDTRLGTGFLDTSKVNFWSVGSESEDAIQLVCYQPTSYGGWARIRVRSETVDVDIPAPGRHAAVAACFALGAAHLKGIPLTAASEALASYKPLELQRGTRWRLTTGQNGLTVEFIDDAQNASPDTVRMILDYVAIRRPSRSVLVLGDMLEIGSESHKKHLALASDILNAGVGLLITVGTETECLHHEVSDKIEAVHF